MSTAFNPCEKKGGENLTQVDGTTRKGQPINLTLVIFKGGQKHDKKVNRSSAGGHPIIGKQGQRVHTATQDKATR